MDKVKFLELKIKELCKLLKIKTPVIKRDNRLGRYMGAMYYNCHIKKHVFSYNGKRLKNKSKGFLLHFILHELGHIKTNARTIPKKEYKAEKYAIKIIKKYYPQYYQATLNWISMVISEGLKEYNLFKKILEEEYEKTI